VKLDDVPRFQQRYQLAGLVLLDDVDALEPKWAAQQQLASIIDHRVRAQRPILLTMRQPLTSQPLSPRLVSRLAGGLLIPLHSPAAETRRELIRRLVSQRPLRLSPEAEQLLVEQRSLTVTQLMGVLNRLWAGSLDTTDAEPQEITATQLRRMLGETPPLTVEPAAIIRLTAKHFGLPVRNLKGASRRKMDVLARSLAMYLIRQLTGASFQQIGGQFGQRDHSTVMHACRKIQLAQDTDSAIRAVTVQIQRRLVAGTAPASATSPDTTTTSDYRGWG
jgi:chromosomal replication initiator protein